MTRDNSRKQFPRSVSDSDACIIRPSLALSLSPVAASHLLPSSVLGSTAVNGEWWGTGTLQYKLMGICNKEVREDV